MGGGGRGSVRVVGLGQRRRVDNGEAGKLPVHLVWANLIGFGPKLGPSDSNFSFFGRYMYVYGKIHMYMYLCATA